MKQLFDDLIITNNKNPIFKLRSRKYFFNKDLYVIPDNNKFILYEAQLGKALLLNDIAINILKTAINSEGKDYEKHAAFFDKLIDVGLLKENCNSDKILYEQEKNYFNPTGISLFLTTRCTMRCIYCYSNGGKIKRSLKWSYAKVAINWLFKNAVNENHKELYIHFHGGGEVTTAIKMMKKCTEYIKKRAIRHGIKVRIEAGLNGIINLKMINWIIENIDGATISLDGLPKIQNFQRPLSTGKESFNMVANTLSVLDKAKFNYGIRTTVTNSSLNELAKSIEFISKNFQPQGIQIEPVFLCGRAIESKIQPINCNSFIEQYREGKERAKKYNKTIIYSGARINTYTSAFCKAVTGNSFCLTTDNSISACYEVNDKSDPRSDLFFFGNIHELTGQISFDFNKIRKLKNLSVENKPNCQKCFCKYHCAGDCPAKLSLNGNALDTSINSRCEINRALTKDQIKEFLI